MKIFEWKKNHNKLDTKINYNNLKKNPVRFHELFTDQARHSTCLTSKQNEYFYDNELTRTQYNYCWSTVLCLLYYSTQLNCTNISHNGRESNKNADFLWVLNTYAH